MRVTLRLCMPYVRLAFGVFVLLIAPSCAGQSPEPPSTSAEADVTAVAVSGAPGAYRFAVTVRSPDTGCGQYANWWEVVTEEGTLIYRRILAHSHVDEQPFTRSGGPVDLGSNRLVIVRAHMSTTGYAGQAFRGRASTGFEPADLPADFASHLAAEAPQPQGCAF